MAILITSIVIDFIIILFSIWFWSFYDRKARFHRLSKTRIEIIDSIAGIVFFILFVAVFIFGMCGLAVFENPSKAYLMLAIIAIMFFLYGSLWRGMSKIYFYRCCRLGIRNIDVDDRSKRHIRHHDVYELYTLCFSAASATISVFVMIFLTRQEDIYDAIVFGLSFIESVFGSILMIVISLRVLINGYRISVAEKRILGILCYFVSLYTFHRFYTLSGTVLNDFSTDTAGLVLVLILPLVLCFPSDFLGKYLFSVPSKHVLKRSQDDFTAVLIRLQSGGLCYGCYMLLFSFIILFVGIIKSMNG